MILCDLVIFELFAFLLFIIFILKQISTRKQGIYFQEATANSLARLVHRVSPVTGMLHTLSLHSEVEEVCPAT